VVKKTHTDKNVVLVNTHSRKVVYLSKTELGKKHDKKVTDEAAIAYPPNATLGKDTGFQGYEPPGVLTWQPKKKPKGHDLSVADWFVNQLLSSGRIVVEHSLSGVKRCRIVKDVLRNTKAGFSDVVMEVACALHNLRVDFRHPIPTFDILAGFA
jgi:DDE superfamily endonuclease